MRRPRDGAARHQQIVQDSAKTTAATCTPARRPTQVHLRGDLRFRHLTERLHALGPRPVGEALLEVASGRDLLDALEEYASLDPTAVARLEARDWPPLPIGMAA